MMSTVASDSRRKNGITRAEVDNFTTIEQKNSAFLECQGRLIKGLFILRLVLIFFLPLWSSTLQPNCQCMSGESSLYVVWTYLSLNTTKASDNFLWRIAGTNDLCIQMQQFGRIQGQNTTIHSSDSNLVVWLARSSGNESRSLELVSGNHMFRKLEMRPKGNLFTLVSDQLHT